MDENKLYKIVIKTEEIEAFKALLATNNIEILYESSSHYSLTAYYIVSDLELNLVLKLSFSSKILIKDADSKELTQKLALDLSDFEKSIGLNTLFEYVRMHREFEENHLSVRSD